MTKSVSIEPTRPEPYGTNARGSGRLYRGEDLAIFRLKSGVPQENVASLMRVVQAAVARYESMDSVQERQAVRYLNAVERAVRIRQRLVEEGEQREAGTWEPAPNRVKGRWRSPGEAAAIKAEQKAIEDLRGFRS
jgi:hypothetical protein